MATYKTPGVYVEEISTLPPSVAEVSTAIPAFIGYTEAGRMIARINTMLEYETIFGKAKPSSFTVQTRNNSLVAIQRDMATDDPEFVMYYSLSLFFKNGGGSCYVISVGDYNSTPAKTHFEAGLAELEKEDEPTLILLTDAVNLPPADYYDLCQQALAQCNKLGDRFAILDVLNGEGKVEEFRNQIGINNLLYGAAYYPYLQTSLNFHFAEDGIKLDGARIGGSTWQKAFGDKGIVVSFTGTAGDTPKVKIVGAGDEITFNATALHLLTINGVNGKTGADVVTAWDAWASVNDSQGFSIIKNEGGSGEVPTSTANVDLEAQSVAPSSDTLASIRSTNTTLYNQIKTAMAQQRMVLPPSPAIAGIYASVDRDRGVWKAPANVSLSAVLGPVVKITHDQQESLNVDPAAGKSINAIRAFMGKGTLVWGARTLAGNDNEWRYVSVRRLFNMIEESTQKATAFAVFEPNDATTWLKVKAMIESYLYGLWEQGALAGSTPEAAYFVNVGLGKTMTAQDILEGRMIVEIGVAAVRPAEFIILRFTHKVQEA
ncbi:MAG: phage tail sheath family protein [Anaerolineae bacterium]|nr:phage tail sheath family protein [Anaerolineae bacterium]